MMIKIGILGCAEIAFRRFLPALMENKEFECVCIAEEYDKSKLEQFEKEFGIKSAESFQSIIEDENIDAVYIPLPPALHFPYAKAALEHGKHVFVEKPSTISYEQTSELVELARKKNLVLQENYMFQYHAQIAKIQKLLKEGLVGEIRLMKASFGFPLRAANDFRYNKALGGGALLDAAGYVTKLARLMLGSTVKVDTATLNGLEGYEVDMYGSATYSNEEGDVLQGSFSMDSYYQCCLEVWGNKGKAFTNRIFTAPPGYTPILELETNEGKQQIELPQDAHFAHSIEKFAEAFKEDTLRLKMYEDLLIQARMIEDIRKTGMQ